MTTHKTPGVVELDSDTTCGCGTPYADHSEILRHAVGAYARSFTQLYGSPTADLDLAAARARGHAAHVADSAIVDHGQGDHELRATAVDGAIRHAMAYGPLPFAELAAARRAHPDSRYHAESVARHALRRRGLKADEPGIALRRAIEAEPLPEPTRTGEFGIFDVSRIDMRDVTDGMTLYIDDLASPRHNRHAWRVLSMSRDVMADGELRRSMHLQSLCDAQGVPVFAQMSYGSPEDAPAFTCRVEIQSADDAQGV